ncbi:hypothetical protein KV572_21545 [Pseudomonas yamanorum]|uniref:Uncharacterized protein n=1 Tax=Pseudomonas yamanorum TaxID=515393 RepID=A0AAJ3H353_9PSED|nr:hypothetical protein [Pseudomonas yamanorum]MBV6663544.1 hypothetical protein [Pseudomonas yamanorum]NWD42501.1 hypothetical protein [Pseudomonas yamanorum]
MSCSEINNAGKLGNYYQHLETCTPRRSVPVEQVSVDRQPPSSLGNKGQGSVGNTVSDAPVLAKLLELFTQFFTQLQSLLTGKEQTNIVPTRVTPAPQTTVVPKPDAPLPAPTPQRLPDLSDKRNGAKPDNIWNGFRQGPDGNCVTISAIKAAMMKFGQSPTDIFRSVQAVGDGYHVVMRDGFRLDLKKHELATAIRGSKFVLMRDPGMLKDAHFLFAVSAKRAQMENNDGRAARSFDAAVHSLNDGEDERVAGEGFLRLGLRSHMKKVSVSAFQDKSLIGMVNRSAHSVAVVDGCEEFYGRKGGPPRFGDAIALV